MPGDTDLDGLFTDDAAPLTDLTNANERNEQALVLYTSAPFDFAATAATATIPPILDLLTEAGEVAGAGVATGQVHHSGIGAGDQTLTQIFGGAGGQSFVSGVDFDRDGFTDFAVLATGTAIDVFFGRPGMNTNYGAPGLGLDNWPDQPPADADRGERLTVAGVGFIGIAAGDVNGDGNPDIVAIDSGTDGVRIILGQGSTTVTPFVNHLTAGQFRKYPAALATDFTFARVAVGNVASDVIADIVVGARNFDPDGAGASGAAGRCSSPTSMARPDGTFWSVRLGSKQAAAYSVSFPTGGGQHRDQFGHHGRLRRRCG